MSALAGLHFAQPWWLLGLLALPAVWLWLRHTRPAPRQPRVERYADPQLLPHLLGSSRREGQGRSRHWQRWAVLWTLLLLALAGPRWDFHEIRSYRPGTDVVVLLDISRSMAVEDVMPSRLSRARQEIDDLLRQGTGLRVGLVAFASVAHVVSPLTEDHRSLRRLLPALGPDLVQFPGSRLSAALRLAGAMLGEREDPDIGRHILVISDGDVADSDLFATVAELRRRGIRVSALGVGTARGGEVPDGPLSSLTDRWGNPVRSALNSQLLQAVARDGGGRYVTAAYLDDDTRQLLATFRRHGGRAEQGQARIVVWHERYYLLLAPALALLLPWFRRRAAGGAP